MQVEIELNPKGKTSAPKCYNIMFHRIMIPLNTVILFFYYFTVYLFHCSLLYIHRCVFLRFKFYNKCAYLNLVSNAVHITKKVDFDTINVHCVLIYSMLYMFAQFSFFMFLFQILFLVGIFD